MEVETKMGTCGEEPSTREEPLSLSPAARLFHSPAVSCYIVIRIGFKTRIKPDVIKAGLKENLPKHPRFASKMVDKGGKKKWITVSVNMDEHVIVPNLDSNMEHPEKFVEDYISNLTTAPLDLSKPLWEIHVLNVKTSEAEAIAVNRIHHSLGDGASLMSLMLACTRQTSNPDALPSIPKKKGADSSNNSCWFCWFFLTIWSAIRLLGNTVVDTVVFMATILFLKDTKTPMKGAPGVEHTTKRFLHRTVSLDHIKQVKNAMNMTVNDVVLGVTQAGLSRYLNRRYDQYQKNEQEAKKKRNNLPKSIRLTANVMVNLRATVDIEALAEMMTKDSNTKWGWGNSIGFIFIPFTIALQHDPLDYVRRAKALIDRKKHSFEAVVTFLTAKLVLKILGSKRTGAIARRAVSNTTLTFSSLVGPMEEISFYGHPIVYIAPSVYGHPHALYMHFQSYVDKMMISIAVDPDTIPDPNQLLDDLEESLKLIRDAVVKKGLTVTNEAV